MTQQPSSFPLGGGLDLVSPALSVAPGRLVAALNYEPLAEGYGRVAGYERYDGTPLASTAEFATLGYRYGENRFAAGNIVSGETSGATGYIALAPYATSGSVANGSLAGTLILADVVGAFVQGENLRIGTTFAATAATPSKSETAPDAVLQSAWSVSAREHRKSQIGMVPGIGPVRGVAIRRGTVFAWRDQDTTRAAMFRSTAVGWVEVSASHVLPFIAGSVEIVEGSIVKQGATTATTLRVVMQSGDYSQGTAVGFLVLTGLSGSFVAGNLTTAAGAQVAKTTGAQTRYVFPAGGKYSLIGHNFYGAANRYSLYGVNGVGQAFEFDGTYVSPISTGMVVDKPTRVAEMSQHLILTFPGGSLQFSGEGEPFVWNAQLGAGEIGLGDDVTDVLQASETAVIFFGASKVATLTGRDLDTFQLDELTEEAGAMAWTAQRLGTAVYLDEGGLRTLSSTSAFGNFKTGTLTEVVSPLLEGKVRAGAKPVASLVCKRKGQYRIYWDDKTGLAVYTGRKSAESIPFTLGDMQPFCATTGELADGTEGMFVGAEDGYVYRLDSGPSFDGVPIEGYAMLPYNHLGSVRQNKRYHAVALEMVAAPTTRIGITCRFDYGDGTEAPDEGRQFVVSGGGGVFATNQSLFSDVFWATPFSGSAEAPVDGFGRNISVLIAAQSGPIESPHVLQAYHVYWSARGMKRIG